jgi:hypothetical protein
MKIEPKISLKHLVCSANGSEATKASYRQDKSNIRSFHRFIDPIWMVTASSSPLNGWLKVLTQLHATSLLHYALYTFASRCLTLTANFRDLWVVAEMNFRFWYLSWQAWHMRESYPRCTLGLSRKNASKPISVNASASSLKKTMSIEWNFKKKHILLFPKKVI